MVCTMSSASSAHLVTIRAVRKIIGAYSRKTASRSSGVCPASGAMAIRICSPLTKRRRRRIDHGSLTRVPSPGSRVSRVPDRSVRIRPLDGVDDDELARQAHPLESESKLLFEGGHDPGRARNCRGVARELLEGLSTHAVIRNELEHEAEGGRIRDTGPIDDRGVKEHAQKYVNLRRAE